MRHKRKKMQSLKKRGFELSINTLVVVILGLAVLSLGILSFNKFFRGAESIKASYDQRTQEALETLLSGGDKIAVPFSQKTVNGGDTAVFGVGILNILGKEQEFAVDVVCDEFIPQGTSQGENCGNIAAYKLEIIRGGAQGRYTLKNNEHHGLPIPVATQKLTREGTFILNLCVCTGPCSTNCKDARPNNLYDSTMHKLYLTVK